MTASPHRPDARGFTPGPWRATADPNDACCWLAHVESVERDERWPDRARFSVADVASDEDARLIAAAPDLYEALRECEQALAAVALTAETETNRTWASEQRQIAVVALARATGEAIPQSDQHLIAPQRDANAEPIQ